MRPKGANIHITKSEGAEQLYFFGRVMDAKTGRPLVNASVDVWMASTNGLYEQQDDKQIEHNLRGKFMTDSNGEYAFYCIRPTPYPVPFDGPAGKLLQLMDRHPYRPGHIHLIVSKDRATQEGVVLTRDQVLKESYEPITTQIFDAKSDYLDNDSVSEDCVDPVHLVIVLT